MADNRVADALTLLSLFGAPAACSMAVAISALCYTQVFVLSFVFGYVSSVLVGFFADAFSTYDVSAGVLAMFFGVPISLISAAAVLGVVFVVRR